MSLISVTPGGGVTACCDPARSNKARPPPAKDTMVSPPSKLVATKRAPSAREASGRNVGSLAVIRINFCPQRHIRVWRSGDMLHPSLGGADGTSDGAASPARHSWNL